MSFQRLFCKSIWLRGDLNISSLFCLSSQMVEDFVNGEDGRTVHLVNTVLVTTQNAKNIDK